MKYAIHEVDAPASAEIIHFFNSLATDLFPPLEGSHIESGYWFLVFHKTTEVVGFAGLVPMTPFPNVGYLKRCYVLPEHRGHGLQRQLLAAREGKALELGWTTLVTETHHNNEYSGRNFEKAGYRPCKPEQPWVNYSANYWVKDLF